MGRQTTKTNNHKKKETNKRLSTKTQKQRLLKALAECLGNVSHACESIGIVRSTYYGWLKDDADFAEAVAHLEEKQIDFVESKLLERISEGDTTATIYYLKTRGKKRGWSEKLEIEAKISPFEQLMIDVD